MGKNRKDMIKNNWDMYLGTYPGIRVLQTTHLTKKFRPRNFYKVGNEHDKQGWTRQEKEVRRKCFQLKI